ncbi:MAG: DUF6599 family protein, partial [Candidatus Aminicenantales bacterium]
MRRIRLSVLGLVLSCVLSASGPAETAPVQAIADLLPKPAGWELSEASQEYLPDNLFEYIDGAAENFLSYDFVRLVLGQYRAADGPGEMTVEIYDMGTTENAFGIYGSERFPESVFIPVGVQGYIEEGVLNFFAGKYYVKLLAYEAGDRTEPALRSFAAKILDGIRAPGDFPLPVRAFPAAGLVSNSEKFILRNFLGLGFLSRGFTAAYRRDDMGEFSLFIVDAGDSAAAGETLEKLIA